MEGLPQSQSTDLPGMECGPGCGGVLHNLRPPACLTEPPGDRARSLQQTFPPMRPDLYPSFLAPLPPPPLPLPPPSLPARPHSGVQKDSPEYRLRRLRNNVAVRRSRDRAKRRAQLTQQRAQQLQCENEHLRALGIRLTRELHALRQLLTRRPLQPATGTAGPWTHEGEGQARAEGQADAVTQCAYADVGPGGVMQEF
ncbi:CCAAT/enhancer-binding protein delta [Amia ocellicauda]|uniref:CCAAT/enhancer-binding protein delta n=1 Tax=Amia ocellicauda TaxID=2972642 RepID=UPI003464A795